MKREKSYIKSQQKETINESAMKKIKDDFLIFQVFSRN